MATFTLSINTDNAAFERYDLHRELARLLRDTADRIERDGVEGAPVRDINGNTVGSYELTDR